MLEFNFKNEGCIFASNAGIYRHAAFIPRIPTQIMNELPLATSLEDFI
jgi:hypothetical protein